jgi:hypothetical protein
MGVSAHTFSGVQSDRTLNGMRRSNRNSLARRPNPFRDLAAGQRRSRPGAELETLRTQQQAARLKAELPALIEDRVGEHIQKLETRLLKDFEQMGQRAVDESTAVLSESLNDRLETLEQISSIQSKTIVNLRDSSRAAEQKVSSVVNSIEKTLSNAVPGFRLEPSRYAQPQIEKPAVDTLDHDDNDGGKHGFCPCCTSTNVRRAYRHGLWEQMLRAFFFAPSRCRACRQKFYKFSL